MAKAKPKQVEKPKRTYAKRKYANWVPPVTAIKNKLAEKEKELAITKVHLNDAKNRMEDLEATIKDLNARHECNDHQLDCLHAEKEALKELLVKLYTL